MKPVESYVIQGIRVFLGAFYVTSGTNYFLLFFPQPTPGGIIGEFVDVITRLDLFACVKVLEAVTGFLILMNWFTPLALILLFPVTVQIFYINLFDPLFFPKWNGARNLAFHVILFFAYFRYYAPIFDAHPVRTPLGSLGALWRNRLNGRNEHDAI